MWNTSNAARPPVIIEWGKTKGVATCDGCGFVVPYENLREKKEYRGTPIPVGTGLRVCAKCDDVPQPYFSLQVLKPDPVPLKNPRPEPSNPSAVTTENGKWITTLDGVVWVPN